MGGQPGSGKSGLLDAATAYLSTPQATAVQIVGDDLRDYHPDYQRLLAADDRTAAAATDQDSGRGVEMSIEHACQSGYSVVVEGTMRNPQVPLRTAEVFRAAGYRVEAWVMVGDDVRPAGGHQEAVDRLCVLERVDAVQQPGRAGVVRGVEGEPAVPECLPLLVVAGEDPQLGRAGRRPGAARTPRIRDVITVERGRPWSPQEVQDYAERAARLSATVPIGHEHRPVLEHLVAAARGRGEHYEAYQAVKADRTAFPTSAHEAVQRPPTGTRLSRALQTAWDRHRDRDKGGPQR